MIKNYLKIGWRNLIKNSVFSIVNIGGLAVGMSITILIGIWIYDELSFNKLHQNYNSIGRVMQNQSFNGEINTSSDLPIPLASTLHTNYGNYFKHIVLASSPWNHSLAYRDKKVMKSGNYMEADGPEMLTLNMLAGTRNALQDPSSILISRSLSKLLFGNVDPLNKTLKLDNKDLVSVSGIYEDLPKNTSMNGLQFIAPWKLYYKSEELQKEGWGNSSYKIYVQIADNTDFRQASAAIKNALNKATGKEKVKDGEMIFLQPMTAWHLYSEFKNGVSIGGAIRYVWLFGIIGAFVLLLACINFMNLSTARSVKRAKEVGIKKCIGSLRSQLIIQFFGESLFVAMAAFILSIAFVLLSLPWFNNVAGKQMHILWSQPLFWVIGICFTVVTGLIAGSYPALYLSSFHPVRVLKGTFIMGRSASISRRALVVVQFTISVILIIGTIVVLKQIAFAQERSVGYKRAGLVSIETTTSDLHDHFEAYRNDLIRSGAALEVAESTSPTTVIYNSIGALKWKGKDPDMKDMFASNGISYEYGKTIGFEVKDGRDFSRQFADSASLILNEAAVKYMGLKDPVGEKIDWWGKNYIVIGVIKDMLMESPYQPVRQTIFALKSGALGFINIRLNSRKNMHDAMTKIERISKHYAPSEPLEYKFADTEYAAKFAEEERIAKLSMAFAGLAILVSCLGLFGLVTFISEQRTKEIGVRKVLGATTLNVWGLLSREFAFLVMISCLIAGPIAYYFLHQWLQNYEYRTEVSWWIFVVSAVGALTISLLTISFQAIKAGLANPVKSLRAE